MEFTDKLTVQASEINFLKLVFFREFSHEFLELV